MTNLETLIAVRELLADETHWTQDVNARNENGAELDIFSNGACQWCILGAVAKVTKKWCNSDFRGILLQAISELGYPDVSIPGFNDENTHTDVLKVLDKAIEIAQDTE